MTTRKQVDLLISQLEKVISHAENDTLDYSVLEEARKLVFEVRRSGLSYFCECIHEWGHKWNKEGDRQICVKCEKYV